MLLMIDELGTDHGLRRRSRISNAATGVQVPDVARATAFPCAAYGAVSGGLILKAKTALRQGRVDDAARSALAPAVKLRRSASARDDDGFNSPPRERRYPNIVRLTALRAADIVAISENGGLDFLYPD